MKQKKNNLQVGILMLLLLGVLLVHAKMERVTIIEYPEVSSHKSDNQKQQSNNVPQNSDKKPKE